MLVRNDGEAESECEAGSLASYDAAENGKLEFLEGRSDDKYFGKLERRDLYWFRYFDEPEQDDKDVDGESEGGSKYDFFYFFPPFFVTFFPK